ncbi:MAG: hypothetical protein WCI57_03430 [Candidatus Berkelbacteria bacterium]
MSTKEKSSTVGVGITIDFRDEALADEHIRIGTLRVMIAGRAEYTIDWKITNNDFATCEIGTKTKTVLLESYDDAEVLLYSFLYSFTDDNWHKYAIVPNPTDDSKKTIWEKKNPSIWYSSNNLNEKIIDQLATLCERTYRSRTGQSSGEPSNTRLRGCPAEHQGKRSK